MTRFLGLLDLICYYCSIFYLKFVWYRQIMFGSNLALFRLTNVGFLLIIISSKSYCLSVLITSSNFPVPALHVKKLIFQHFWAWNTSFWSVISPFMFVQSNNICISSAISEYVVGFKMVTSCSLIMDKFSNNGSCALMKTSNTLILQLHFWFLIYGPQ